MLSRFVICLVLSVTLGSPSAPTSASQPADEARVREEAKTAFAQGVAESGRDEANATLDLAGRAAEGAGVQRFERLPYTHDEAMVIAAKASKAGPGASLTAIGFDATRELALSPALADYRIVHFATHTALDARRPERSGIVLSLVDRDRRIIDGFLRLHDIFTLRLSSDVVVLTACQTALGKDIRGEGLAGFVVQGDWSSQTSVGQTTASQTSDAQTSDAQPRFRGPKAELTPTVVSTSPIRAGSRVRLAVKVTLPEKIHVQSDKPREKAYIPTVLTVEAPTGVSVQKVGYPPASDFTIEGLDRPLAVFERVFTITVDLTLAKNVPAGDVTVPARLRYQACDDRVCYPPATVDTRWTLRVRP